MSTETAAAPASSSHFRSSPSIASLAPALVKAQAQVKGAVKDSANPFFKTKYADLSSVWEACREAANDNGLAVVQFPIASEAGVGVETILLHSSGEWMANDFVLPMAKEDAQGGGSCITYARRYAVAAIFRVCPEDDDGNAAAAGSKAVRDKGLAILKVAARDGTGALETAWKTLSVDMRRACQQDLPGLKVEAARVGGNSKKETAHANS